MYSSRVNSAAFAKVLIKNMLIIFKQKIMQTDIFNNENTYFLNLNSNVTK